MKNSRYIYLGTLVVVFLIFAGKVFAQGTTPLPDSGDSVILTAKLIKSDKKALKYISEIRNEGKKAIYYCSNPQRLNGEYGYYILRDQNDGAVVEIQSRVFNRDIVWAIPSYANHTGVELKRLEAGKTAQLELIIKWPLLETAPPILFRSSKRLLDRKDIKHIRFTVGYFDEEDGLSKLLKGKTFGPFTKGDDELEVGTFGAKRLYEIQRLASTEISVP